MNPAALIYALFGIILLILGILIYWKIPKETKDKFTKKTKITGFSFVTFYIFLIINPIFIKGFAGEVLSQLASSILDFISLVSITVGILEIIL